jgi:hypothetical protein
VIPYFGTYDRGAEIPAIGRSPNAITNAMARRARLEHAREKPSAGVARIGPLKLATTASRNASIASTVNPLAREYMVPS